MPKSTVGFDVTILCDIVIVLYEKEIKNYRKWWMSFDVSYYWMRVKLVLYMYNPFNVEKN
jgi:hypothetical protein